MSGTARYREGSGRVFEDRGWVRDRGTAPARWGCAGRARPEPAVPPWARGGRCVAVPGGTSGPVEERTDLCLFKKCVN